MGPLAQATALAGVSSGALGESKDLSFMRKLLALIEESGIPAPCPLEQVRFWSV